MPSKCTHPTVNAFGDTNAYAARAANVLCSSVVFEVVDAVEKPNHLFVLLEIEWDLAFDFGSSRQYPTHEVT